VSLIDLVFVVLRFFWLCFVARHGILTPGCGSAVSRKFPQSLVAEHKAAVKSFFTKVAVVVSILGIGLLKLVSKLFF
jgi:hypothetical protein